MKECKIILSGALGRMGRVITAAAEDYGCKIVAGIDVAPAVSELPLYASPAEIGELDADCIIDFSHHTALPALLDFAKARKLPIVVCTTGHTAEETALMREASLEIPVFFSRNMSVGINLIIELAKKATAILGESYDIEIIEKHHNKKLDAPSGTALMIADAISEVTPYDAEYIYERQSRREARSKNEIGLHAVRGGTIVGEHEVIFAGTNEVVTLSHSAQSREVFAIGSLRAARYLAGKAPGMYDMGALVAEMV